MVRLFIISTCLIFSLTAQARTAPSPEIRSVQTDSTDVFAVLTTLSDAQASLEKRDFISARHGFESVLMHDPKLEVARAGLRRTMIAQGDIQSARPYLSDATSADSVIVRIKSGLVKNPEALLRATLQNNPDPRLWTLLGQLQDARREFSAARQSYAMAGLAGARPGLAENNIGQSHWIAGEYELALLAFTKAAKTDPADTQFDNNRRRTLIHLGQTHDAISGLGAERAGLFLAQAADKAAIENEPGLARLLYQKSLNITPRHNPLTAEKLARLK